MKGGRKLLVLLLKEPKHSQRVDEGCESVTEQKQKQEGLGLGVGPRPHDLVLASSQLTYF